MMHFVESCVTWIYILSGTLLFWTPGGKCFFLNPKGYGRISIEFVKTQKKLDGMSKRKILRGCVYNMHRQIANFFPVLLKASSIIKILFSGNFSLSSFCTRLHIFSAKEACHVRLHLRAGIFLFSLICVHKYISRKDAWMFFRKLSDIHVIPSFTSIKSEGKSIRPAALEALNREKYLYLAASNQ